MESSKFDIKNKKDRKELLQRLKEKRDKYFGTNGQVSNKHTIMDMENKLGNLIRSTDHPLREHADEMKKGIRSDAMRAKYINKFSDAFSRGKISNLDHFDFLLMKKDIDKQYLEDTVKIIKKYNISESSYSCIADVNNNRYEIAFDEKLDIPEKMLEEIKSLNKTKIKLQSIKA